MNITLPGIPAPRTQGAGYIAPNAVIAGNVELGENTSVWFSASIRCDGPHYIKIGKNCNIQDSAVLHSGDTAPIVIGDGVSIGHCACVHGCTLEDEVLVGINATVLNNAHLGKGCLVAAGALVLEGTEVPPYTLVYGVPAKFRPIREERRSYNGDNWKQYLELSDLYMRSLSIE